MAWSSPIVMDIRPHTWDVCSIMPSGKFSRVPISGSASGLIGLILVDQSLHMRSLWCRWGKWTTSWQLIIFLLRQFFFKLGNSHCFTSQQPQNCLASGAMTFATCTTFDDYLSLQLLMLVSQLFNVVQQRLYMLFIFSLPCPHLHLQSVKYFINSHLFNVNFSPKWQIRHYLPSFLQPFVQFP